MSTALKFLAPTWDNFIWMSWYIPVKSTTSERDFMVELIDFVINQSIGFALILNQLKDKRTKKLLNVILIILSEEFFLGGTKKVLT